MILLEGVRWANVWILTEKFSHKLLSNIHTKSHNEPSEFEKFGAWGSFSLPPEGGGRRGTEIPKNLEKIYLKFPFIT